MLPKINIQRLLAVNCFEKVNMINQCHFLVIVVATACLATSVSQAQTVQLGSQHSTYMVSTVSSQIVPVANANQSLFINTASQSQTIQPSTTAMPPAPPIPYEGQAVSTVQSEVYPALVNGPVFQPQPQPIVSTSNVMMLPVQAPIVHAQPVCTSGG